MLAIVAARSVGAGRRPAQLARGRRARPEIAAAARSSSPSPRRRARAVPPPAQGPGRHRRGERPTSSTSARLGARAPPRGYAGQVAGARLAPAPQRQRRSALPHPAAAHRPLKPVDPPRRDSRGAAQEAQQVAARAAVRTRPRAGRPARRRPRSRRPAALPPAPRRSRMTRAPMRSAGRAAPGPGGRSRSRPARPRRRSASRPRRRSPRPRPASPAERSSVRSPSGGRRGPSGRQKPRSRWKSRALGVLAGSASVRVSASTPIRSRSCSSSAPRAAQRRAALLVGYRHGHLGYGRRGPRPASNWLGVRSSNP